MAAVAAAMYVAEGQEEKPDKQRSRSECAELDAGHYFFDSYNEKEDRTYQIKCDVIAKGQYGWQTEYKEGGIVDQGCNGSICLNTNCELDYGYIIFSSTEDPRSLLLLTTWHTAVNYPTKLEKALDRAGFLRHPRPSEYVESTFCNTKKLYTITGQGVDKADLGVMEYLCERHPFQEAQNCTWPSTETLARVNDALKSEYPSAEMALYISPLYIIAFLVVSVFGFAWWRSRAHQRKRERRSDRQWAIALEERSQPRPAGFPAPSDDSIRRMERARVKNFGVQMHRPFSSPEGVAGKRQKLLDAKSNRPSSRFPVKPSS